MNYERNYKKSGLRIADEVQYYARSAGRSDRLTRQTIIAIEKGNYTPSVILALKIAKFFKQPVEDIFQIKY